MNDIVVLLRQAANDPNIPLGRSFEYLRMAETIERLRAENEILRERIETTREKITELKKQINANRVETDKIKQIIVGFESN